jgi:uncharacterized protein (TIGR03083 family)
MSHELPTDDTPLDVLKQAWSQASESFLALAHDLTLDEWQTQSILPAWTNGDIVAHVAHLDGLLLGELQIDHEPNWEELQHAQTPFQKLTEYGVDVRRSRSQQEVLDELDRVAQAQRDRLSTVDPNAKISFLGFELGVPRLVRRRVLDTWTHLLDIEYGTQRALSPQEGLAPLVSAGMWVEGLPRVLAKDVQAPVGTVLRLNCTGPGPEFVRTIAVDSGARGMFVSDSEPAVSTINISWLHFTALCGGRIAREVLTIEVLGDIELGEAFLANLSMAP